MIALVLTTWLITASGAPYSVAIDAVSYHPSMIACQRAMTHLQPPAGYQFKARCVSNV